MYVFREAELAELISAMKFVTLAEFVTVCEDCSWSDV
jgi:hypothetical protein